MSSWVVPWVFEVAGWAASPWQGICRLRIDILFPWNTRSPMLRPACTGLRGCRRCVPYCASVCRWIEPWTKRFLSPKAHFKFRGVMHSLQAILDLWQIGPWSSPVLVLLSLIVFSSVLCPLLLQTLVGAWWARASACLLADPTMSGRLSWSETGSTHRLCATYCCWTTQSRPSKSM